jgi:hypothetical protein
VAEGGEPGVVQRRSSRRWVVVGALAVVLVLVIGYVLGGAAAASGPVSRADSALHTTIDHNNTVAGMFTNDPFKNIDFSSNNPDFAGAKTALATVSKKIATWQEMVAGDRAALQRVRGDLNDSVLTLPEKATIDSHRRRVDAALSAMATAQKGIDILGKQVAFLDPLMDAFIAFEAVSKAADAHDLGAMQSQLTTTAASLQKAITLSQGASLPSQLTSGLNTLQKMITDMQALVKAAQAGDVGAVNADVALVDADAKALDNIDQSGIEQAESALIQPLSDAYDRSMKIASGG